MSDTSKGCCGTDSAFMIKLSGFSLLFFRLILAYGFFEPGLNKWNNIEQTAAWFENSLNIPYPLINAYLAAVTELLGVVLLTLGLFTRWIAFPLMVVMGVAIYTVHWQNGFPVNQNGFEIPLYYLLMLFNLLVFGGGYLSLDALRCKLKKKN